MAGRRKYRGAPLRVVKVTQRSTRYFETELSGALDESDRLAVAMRYLLASTRRAAPELARRSQAAVCRFVLDEIRRLNADNVRALRQTADRKVS